MQPIHLAWVDYTILIAYVAFVIGIGWVLARYMKTSSDFLTSGHYHSHLGHGIGLHGRQSRRA